MGIHMMPPLYEQVIKAKERFGPPITETFHPDPDPEVSSVDGYVYQNGLVSLDWLALIDSPGSGQGESIPQGAFMYIRASVDDQKWRRLDRSIFLFETSEIEPGSEILEAVFSVWGTGRSPGVNDYPNINLYSSNPATDTAIIPADFAALGALPFSSAIEYLDWDKDGWNDFILNAAGRAAITPGGITKLGLRNANFDVARIAPSWHRFALLSFTGYFADRHIFNERPKLEVTWKAPI